MTTNKTEKMSDKHRVPEGELSDSEDEGDNRRDQRSFRERSSSLTRRRDKPVTVTPYIPNSGAFEDKAVAEGEGDANGNSELLPNAQYPQTSSIMMDLDDSPAKQPTPAPHP